MLNANVKKMFTLALECNLPIMFTVRTVHYDCYTQVAIMENFVSSILTYMMSVRTFKDLYGQVTIMDRQMWCSYIQDNLFSELNHPEIFQITAGNEWPLIEGYYLLDKRTGSGPLREGYYLLDNRTGSQNEAHSEVRVHCSHVKSSK